MLYLSPIIKSCIEYNPFLDYKLINSIRKIGFNYKSSFYSVIISCSQYVFCSVVKYYLEEIYTNYNVFFKLIKILYSKF